MLVLLKDLENSAFSILKRLFRGRVILPMFTYTEKKIGKRKIGIEMN